MKPATIVFISYSHDSPQHQKKVAQFAARLRRDGYNAIIDQEVNGTPKETWPRWMMDRLDEAQYVLVICTQTYYHRFRGHEKRNRGKGVDWEGAIITQQIYDARHDNLKYIPVSLTRTADRWVPDPLRGQTRYLLNSKKSYERLRAAIDGVAGVNLGALGRRRVKRRATAQPLTFGDEAAKTPNATSTTSGSTSKKNSARAPALESGFIVVSDIWDVSSLSPSDMVPVIDTMWSIASKLALVKTGRAFGLQDGLVLATSGMRHGELLALCEQWIEKFRAETVSAIRPGGVELRLSIHHGQFYAITHRNVLIGSGPNECRRLLQTVGPGQIVLSEDFVNGWKEDVGWKEGSSELADIFPSADKPPIGMQLRHGKSSFFRFYKYQLEAPVFYTPLALANKAHQLLFRIIQEIEDEFVEVIRDRLPRITAKKIDARVSLFVYDKNNPNLQRLVSTEYRCMQGKTGDDVSSPVAKGSTYYEIGGQGGVQGLIGRAFVNKETLALNNLPDYRKPKDRRRYVSALSNWNVPEPTVLGFKRKARCFVAVPCWLSKDAPHADAVICIDTMHPLDGLQVEFLQELGHSFGRYFGILISALLWLRF